MPHQTGKQIQTKILNYIRTKLKGRAIAYKIEIANERGVPDILMCLNGHFVAVEVKGHGDTIKPIQIAQLNRIKDRGGKAFVVESLEAFEILVKEL